jgi:hypothetical protein
MVVSYPAGMRFMFLTLVGLLGACSKDETAAPAKEEEHRVLACSPADDAGAKQAADAGVVAKILAPTNGQKFKSTDRITFKGTGSDPTEGTITDKERMIWNLGDAVKGVNPEGEGPEDTAGPFPAGDYLLRFDVSNKQCLTAADLVTITIE